MGALVGAGAARTTGAGREAGGARMPELAVVPLPPPLPKGLSKKDRCVPNENKHFRLSYCPSRAATGS